MVGGGNIYKDVWFGIFIPFIGTSLGAACVFFVGRGVGDACRRTIAGFSAGVMVAASIWSLLIPSMEIAKERGLPSAIPAASGFLFGIVFFILCDRLVLGRLSFGAASPYARRGLMSAVAVTVHNLPEGMAVGAIYGEILCSGTTDGLEAALALSIGIAVQNFPEGAIVSMPINSSGGGKIRSFAIGALSGAVEPLGALLTVAAVGLAVPMLPYLLSFAAGAMMYAVLDEFSDSDSSGTGVLWVLAFSMGFVLMMSLDVLLG